jgi:bifunctional DNA-binding transcriptional regulator/antitoxin component of YhaV-PrlF toxin-antitoxin module
MSRTIKMDRAGRLVIPRNTRERYGLIDGTHDLEIEETAEGILLHPRGEDIPATRHASGWVVFRSGETESIDPVATVAQSRERRHRGIAAPAAPTKRPRRGG